MKKILLLLWLTLAGINVANAQAPSIGSLVKAFQQAASDDGNSLKNLLERGGYSYRFTQADPDYGGGQSAEYVFSKNCKVLHEESMSGLKYWPAKETPNSSIIIVNTTGNRLTSVNVQVYSHAVFKTWVSQLKALGYRTTSDGGSGNRGRDWQYVSRGKPTINIWNDYTNTYSLTISR